MQTLKEMAEKAAEDAERQLIAFVNRCRDAELAAPAQNFCADIAATYRRFAQDFRDSGNPLAATHYDRIAQVMRYASALLPLVSETADSFRQTHVANCVQGVALTLAAAGVAQENLGPALDLVKGHLLGAVMLGHATAILERQGRIDNVDDLTP